MFQHDIFIEAKTSQGIGDPDYAVLKFTTHSLRYYSDFNPRDYRLNTDNSLTPLP